MFTDSSIPLAILQHALDNRDQLAALGIEAVMIRTLKDEDPQLSIYLLVSEASVVSEECLSLAAARFGMLGLLRPSMAAGTVSCLYIHPVCHILLRVICHSDLLLFSRRSVRFIWQTYQLGSEMFGTGTSQGLQPLIRETSNIGLFWYWLHRAFRCVEREELFDAIDRLSLIRSQILVPLLLSAGNLPRRFGTKRMEERLPNQSQQLSSIIPAYSGESCASAIAASLNLFVRLATQLELTTGVTNAELAAPMQRLLEQLSSPRVCIGETTLSELNNVSEFEKRLERITSCLRNESTVMGLASSPAINSSTVEEIVRKTDQIQLLVVVECTGNIDISVLVSSIQKASHHRVIDGEYRTKEKCLLILSGYQYPVLRIAFVTLTEFRLRKVVPSFFWRRDAAIVSAEPAFRSEDLAQVSSNEVVSSDKVIAAWETEFWPNVVDGIAQIERGELFRAIHTLDRLRTDIVSRLIGMVECKSTFDMKRLEKRFPNWVNDVSRTVSLYDVDACFSAFYYCIRLYLHLRGSLRDNDAVSTIGTAVLEWTDEMHSRRRNQTEASIRADCAEE